MTDWQIILAPLVFLAGCQPLSGQHVVPVAQPTVVYPMTSAPPILMAAPPYLQPSPIVIQPAPQLVPIYPPQSTIAPLPSQTPGSIFGPPTVEIPGQAGPTTMIPGVLPQPPGGGIPEAMPQSPVVEAAPPNSIVVPVVDEELAWDQIVDVVSDYFTVAREQRARRGEVWSEGRIETAPQDGATWLEPHREDSVGTFNRWESTFQTIRRRALVRVVPDAAGYLVEVVVEKELEDLPSPEKSTAGAATFRNDGSLPSRRLEQIDRTLTSPQWIQLGRDPPLEQRMLAEIHARLNGIATGPRSVFAQ